MQNSPEERKKYIRDAIQFAEAQFKQGRGKREIEDMLVAKGFERIDAYRIAHMIVDKVNLETEVKEIRGALIAQMMGGAVLCLIGVALIPTGFIAFGAIISGGLLFIKSLLTLVNK